MRLDPGGSRGCLGLRVGRGLGPHPADSPARAEAAGRPASSTTPATSTARRRGRVTHWYVGAAPPRLDLDARIGSPGEPRPRRRAAAVTGWEVLAVALAGLAAGTINTVVGSGTLVTFPVLLAVGYPPVLANVSNTVGLVPGSVSGAHRLPRRAVRPARAAGAARLGVQ